MKDSSTNSKILVYLAMYTPGSKIISTIELKKSESMDKPPQAPKS